MICAVVSYLLPFRACNDVLCSAVDFRLCTITCLRMKMSWSCRKETWSVSWRDVMMAGLWVCVIDHCIDSPLHHLSHTKFIRIYYRALFWSCMFSFYLYPDSYVCTGFSVQVHPRGQNSSALSQEIMWKLLICDTILLKKWWFVWGDSNTMLKQPDPFGTSNEDFFSPAKFGLSQMNVQVCDQ